MAHVLRSTKEQIVLVAERLFGVHGLDGVSLRQIGAAAGNGNKMAVQYHFGDKDGLIQAIFEYRLPHINERRRVLVEVRRPDDLRSLVECYVVPLLEQGEQAESHYLSFIVQAYWYSNRHLLTRPLDSIETTQAFLERARAFLPDVPEPLRTHRIAQAMAFIVHATADRERARDADMPVLPFAVHVSDLLDGLNGFLEAPVSPAALTALIETNPDRLTWPVLI
jgi:AcrR family transcriptional regulator